MQHYLTGDVDKRGAETRPWINLHTCETQLLSNSIRPDL